MREVPADGGPAAGYGTADSAAEGAGAGRSARAGAGGGAAATGPGAGPAGAPDGEGVTEPRGSATTALVGLYQLRLCAGLPASRRVAVRAAAAVSATAADHAAAVAASAARSVTCY